MRRPIALLAALAALGLAAPPLGTAPAFGKDCVKFKPDKGVKKKPFCEQPPPPPPPDDEPPVPPGG